MKKIFLSVLFSSLLLLSCKGDKDTEKEVTEKLKAFTITFDAIVEKDDVFQIFYNEDGTDNFPAENAVTINIVGNPNTQEIIFVLPDDVMPSALRFDIGANKELTQVTFKGFKIEYLQNVLKSDAKDFHKYFYPNTQVELDSVSAVAKIKMLEADQGYDPILGSTTELKAKIQSLYNVEK
jgi:hypothetical protein